MKAQVSDREITRSRKGGLSAVVFVRLEPRVSVVGIVSALAGWRKGGGRAARNRYDVAGAQLGKAVAMAFR